MERYWAGQPLEGIAYSQQAIAMLEQSPERARLGMAQFVLGLNCLLLGDRERALEAAAQAVLNWRLTRSALPWPWGALATPTWSRGLLEKRCRVWSKPSRPCASCNTDDSKACI